MHISEPLVSVIIPTYNRKDHERDARLLNTVKSVLDQTYRTVEVIVVDDFSKTPASYSLDSIADGRLKIIRHEHNQDVSAARNTGIAEARGELVALLDHDDLWKKEKLRHQIEYMRANQLQASVTDFSGSEEHPEYSRHNSNKNPAWLILTGSFLAMASSMLIHRKVVDMVGDFDTRMPQLQDWDWLLRYHKRGHKLGIVPETLVVYEGSHRRAPEVELNDLKLIEQKYVLELPKDERKILEAGLMWRKARVEFSGRKHRVSGAAQLASVGLQHPIHFSRYLWTVYEETLRNSVTSLQLRRSNSPIPSSTKTPNTHGLN